MKGLLFTEFLTFAETAFSDDDIEEAIEKAGLASGGAYATTGQYPYQELVDIIGHLPMDAVGGVEAGMQAFGTWLAGRFKTNYSHFFDRHQDAISFFESIDDHIHVEVRKLYPDAVPPRVTMIKETETTVKLVYSSHRPFAIVAVGLVIGSLNVYGGQWSVAAITVAEGHTGCEIMLKNKE